MGADGECSAPVAAFVGLEAAVKRMSELHDIMHTAPKWEDDMTWDDYYPKKDAWVATLPEHAKCCEHYHYFSIKTMEVSDG